MRHHSIFSSRTEPLMVMLFMFVTMLAGIVVLAGTILASSIVSAEGGSTVAQVGVTVPAICTMTGTGMDSHNAEIVNGTYVSNIGITTLHAFCNDNEGFAIYAAGYTGNEIGGTNSNKLVGTTASSNTTIVSGTTTTAGSPDISNWAIKLAITQDSGDTTSTNAFMIDSAPNVDLPSQAEQSATQASFSEYHVVPNEYTKVAHKNSMTDMAASTGGVKLTTTYAAYISKTQPADTYTGQVIYTLVHPASAAAPIVCNPTGTTIGTNTSTDVKCMQDITSTNKSSVLASMTEGASYSLYDSRDDQQYNVAKLIDGNIWMLDNLALDPTDTITAANLSQQNTNAPDNAIANLLRGGNTDNVPGWTSEAVINKISDWNDTSPNNAFEYPYVNNSSKDTVVTSYGNSNGKVGVYYNICAATMGTYCYPSGVHDQPDPIYDLCPANWRMPSSSNVENILTTIAGSSQVFDPAKANDALNVLSLSLSGSFRNSLAEQQNTGGIIYTRSISSYTIVLAYGDQYILVVDNTRDLGNSVRCILDH